jgi:Ser/Thr protein kinase RdoA (MazF antagonist)
MGEMEAFIYDLFNEDLLFTAAERFQIEQSSLEKVSTSESFIYSGICQGKEIILRITHSSHRSVIEIEGEMEWIAHLISQGVPASRPVLSVHSNVIEEIPTKEGQFFVTVFEKAPGRHPNIHDWKRDFFIEWGRTTGAMHKAAVLFDYTTKRPMWQNEYNITAIHTYGEPDLIEVQRQLICDLEALPKDESVYGIIHSDFEDGNFFIHHGTIHPFDFDECQYHWFAYDIGNAVRAASWFVADTNPVYTVEEFLNDFLEGYYSEYHLDFHWIEKLPTFIRLRDLCIYVYLIGKRGHDMSEWEKRFLARMKEEIRAKKPCVQINFSQIRRY